MNIATRAAFLTLVLAAPASAQTVIKDVGLLTPECIRYDAAGDRYLVANINGGPADADNNGFISIVSPDGRVQTLKWIAGGAGGVTLDAPKGLAIRQNTLYVADITRVRMFDLTSGAPRGEHVVAGASFLNDLAVAADGTIYVTDTGGLSDQPADIAKGAIWRIAAQGQATAIARGAELKRPNGIAFDPAGNLVIVPFGGAEAQTRKQDGALVDTKPLPGGGLDGLVVLPDGSRLASSWQTNQVFQQFPDGRTRVVADKVEAPAAIGFDSRRQRILVPHFTQNALSFVDLK